MPSRPALVLLTSLGLAGPGLALEQDSAADGSVASQAASVSATALTASGVKTAVGVSVLPVSVAGAGSAAVGSVAVAGGASALGAGVGASRAVGDSVAFASRPLPISPDVVVAPEPKPQGPPKVPYAAQPSGA